MVRILQNGATQISFVNSSNTQYALNGPALSNNQWYHLVGQYDPSSGFKIYINGVLAASGCTTPAVCTGSAPRQTTASLYFGGPHITTTAYNGAMDEIRISNIARNPNDIRQAYEAGLRSHPITIDFGADWIVSILLPIPVICHFRLMLPVKVCLPEVPTYISVTRLL